ncbi:MAG: uroporphyrinogen decarboxylase family protein [Pirellulaceae bacterium]
MTDSRQIVQQALAGERTSRLATGPLAVHYCARQCGVSLRRYTSDARTLADCVLRYYERFHPDAVWVSADTWVTAQAMGARVGFAGDDQPMGGVGTPLIQSLADVERIAPPDVGRQGRWPMMIEALKRIVEALRGRAFVVACFDQYPFSLACALMGMQRAMTGLLEDRSLIDALMDRGGEYTQAYAAALAAAGADMLSGGDSPAGLIGPHLYREVVLPSEQRVISGIRGHTALPISLHICGNATPILADMARSGADVLELDHQVDFQQASRTLGPKVAIWGNLDPVAVLARGSVEDVTEATRRLIQTVRACGHRRFVLSSGCTLAMETPAENLAVMLHVAASTQGE